MDLLFRLSLGIAFSVLIAGIAYTRNSLSQSGTAGAVLIGTIIFGFGGWVLGVVLISFFVLSSLLSHYKTAAKKNLSEKFEKGNKRDLGQVLANGGAGALVAIVYFFYPEPWIMAAFFGGIASVNADTWATELGVLAKNGPRLITTFKKVEIGTSGGISIQGTAAAFTGALAIALLAGILLILDGAVNTWFFILPTVAAGMAGCLFDSLLGATVQVIYFSQNRGRETEKKTDRDGSANEYLRGWCWLNNDWVNFISSLVAMAVSIFIWFIII